MADGTGLRLDTADLALDAGWDVRSTDLADEFLKGGITIDVQYSLEDDIEAMAKWGLDDAHEVVDAPRPDSVELLRFWLTGRRVGVGEPKQIHTATVDRYADGWTRKEFVDAVEGLTDRAFLLRILELVDANSAHPKQGAQTHLFFGVRPRGWMFVYPFGRRHPPFKFAVRSSGQLRIAGCWTGFPKVKGHRGFRDLAALLGLDETGPGTGVCVDGLDPDEVWRVGEAVSRAIN
ncbi:hypothetical protein SAMN04488581_5264 [Mycolicibacterium neoaurum]|uniref:hypothetical protein n=1 Tax=Mycolicibacterium neoaurum TaxID=1795 RepID=UPI00088BD436|nr:hypothetical protein [Mycolicibacterium neoaurum]SDF04709.1 hypothetical protein SAMN04488581_5264 [Mycolicibacterium neoaurum]